MKEETAVELDAINYSEMDGFTPIAIFTMKDENDRPDFPTELVSASLEAEEGWEVEGDLFFVKRRNQNKWAWFKREITVKEDDASKTLWKFEGKTFEQILDENPNTKSLSYFAPKFAQLDYAPVVDIGFWWDMPDEDVKVSELPTI